MEIVRGNTEQQLLVHIYFSDLRASLPLSELSRKTMNTAFEVWLKESESLCKMDVGLFFKVTTQAEQTIQRKYDPSFKVLPHDRYVIGEVNTEIDTDTGGFNSKYSRGFKYLSNCGYAALLNQRYTHNPQVVALELARSYLHDSLHAGTFRTIRVLPEDIYSKFPVYREQYGINFRHADGASYSAPYATKNTPERINLNLLMDGVVVLMTAHALIDETSKLQDRPLNDFERTIVDDVDLKVEQLPDDYRGRNFHQNVTIPSRAFIEHWGGDPLYQILIKAILTGKLSEVTRYFDEKTNMKNAWQTLFKSESY
jgi:hypothetical protein